MTPDDLIAVASDDGLRASATTGGMVLAGLPVVLVIALLVYALGAYGGRFLYSSDSHEARLLTYSSAFWARWPHDRLGGVPYAELAAEASRCQDLITFTRAAMRPRRLGSPTSTPGDYLCRRLAAYEGMLAAVRNAMAGAAPPGWPPPVIR